MSDAITAEWISALTQAGAAVSIAVTMYLIAKLVVPSFVSVQTNTTRALAEAFEAATAAYKESQSVMREAQEGQRLFYVTKVDEVRSELRAEINALKAEGAEKDQRIAELEAENKVLKARVAELEKARTVKKGTKKNDKAVSVGSGRASAGHAGL